MPLSSAEASLCRHIASRQAAMVDDLRLLVSIPTGQNHAPGLDQTRSILTSRLAAMGAQVELIPGDPKPDWLYGAGKATTTPPTAVCRRHGGVQGREVLLAGHMDTVHDPASGFCELTIAGDGRTATGPGVVDMKGGLVIAVHALEALEAVGIRLPWTFLLNSDEETGSYHSERTIRAESTRVAGELLQVGEEEGVVVVDGGVSGVGLALEPATADGGLVIERAGAGQFLLEAHGKSAHVGRDFASGISAVTAIARCITEIANLSDPARGRIANVGPLQGSSATNVVPDLARAWGNVRFSDQTTADDLTSSLAEIAARHTASTGGLPRILLKTSFIRAAKPASDAVMRLAEAYRAVNQDLPGGPIDVPFSKTAGVCDGNVMQSVGLACIDTVGVRGGGLHTPDEWIELDSLVSRSQALAVLMLRLQE